MWSSVGRTARPSTTLYRVLTSVHPSEFVPVEPRWSALICLRYFVHHSEAPRSANEVLENGQESPEDRLLRNTQYAEGWMLRAAPGRLNSEQPCQAQVHVIATQLIKNRTLQASQSFGGQPLHHRWRIHVC